MKAMIHGSDDISTMHHQGKAARAGEGHVGAEEESFMQSVSNGIRYLLGDVIEMYL